MGYSLSACQQFNSGTTELAKCLLQANHGIMSSSLSGLYTICDPDNLSTGQHNTDHCSELYRAQSFWQKDEDPRFEYTYTQLNGKDWIAVRLPGAANGSQLWISTDKINHFVKQLWDLRDNTLIYVVPAILLLLAFMALYMTRFVIGVLTELKQSLATINVNNLDKRVRIIPHFTELEPLASVFEQMQIRMERTLEQRQRFASDASHELRTPLSILRGTTQRLIDESDPGSDTQMRLRSVGDEVERLIDIVDRLLLLSQADSDELRSRMTHLNFSNLLESYVQDVQALESDIDVQSQIEPGIFLHADKTLLTQILQNLFANALKYNIPNGWIRAILVRRQDTLELKIENTTSNLRPEVQEHAFERFFRGDPSRSRQTGGLGLGLSICQEIARAHGGSLSLEITKDNRFIIRFVAPLSPVL
jgi:signal transduction histidine kinase